MLLASAPAVAGVLTVLGAREVALALSVFPGFIGFVLHLGCRAAFFKLYAEHGGTWRQRRQVRLFMHSRAILVQAARSVGVPAPVVLGTGIAVGQFLVPVIGGLLFLSPDIDWNALP